MEFSVLRNFYDLRLLFFDVIVRILKFHFSVVLLFRHYLVCRIINIYLNNRFGIFQHFYTVLA